MRTDFSQFSGVQLLYRIKVPLSLGRPGCRRSRMKGPAAVAGCDTTAITDALAKRIGSAEVQASGSRTAPGSRWPTAICESAWPIRFWRRGWKGISSRTSKSAAESVMGRPTEVSFTIDPELSGERRRAPVNGPVRPGGQGPRELAGCGGRQLAGYGRRPATDAGHVSSWARRTSWRSTPPRR